MQSENPKIYLFDGKNLPNWSSRMESLLEERQLIDCIRKEADEIPEFRVADADTTQVKAPEDSNFMKTERKLHEAQYKSLLVKKIADSQLDYIKGKITPKAIWATFQNVFAKKGIFGQFYLLKQLAVMKYSETEPMEKHLLRFERIIRVMASADILMHDRLVVFNLLETMLKCQAAGERYRRNSAQLRDGDYVRW